VDGGSGLPDFFLIKHTKTGINIPIGHKIYQITIKIPNGHKIDKMAENYTYIFHCKTLPNLPKLGFLV
jgi:hypothetical protein